MDQPLPLGILLLKLRPQVRAALCGASHLTNLTCLAALLCIRAATRSKHHKQHLHPMVLDCTALLSVVTHSHFMGTVKQMQPLGAQSSRQKDQPVPTHKKWQPANGESASPSSLRRRRDGLQSIEKHAAERQLTTKARPSRVR